MGGRNKIEESQSMSPVDIYDFVSLSWGYSNRLLHTCGSTSLSGHIHDQL